jgi:hypothetical protein
MLRTFTIACVFWIGAANAQDCSQYMTAKYNAAVAGNLQLLYQYDALTYTHCHRSPWGTVRCRFWLSA